MSTVTEKSFEKTCKFMGVDPKNCGKTTLPPASGYNCKRPYPDTDLQNPAEQMQSPKPVVDVSEQAASGLMLSEAAQSTTAVVWHLPAYPCP